MRVILSVAGRFHVFDQALQLLKRGFLERLITSHPKFSAVRCGIPKEKVRTVIIKEILERGWNHLPALLKSAYNPQYAIHEIFDYFASRHLIPADIFVGGSSFSLKTLRQAKVMGMVGIIDRGSTHILYQNKILKEEYEKYGVRIKPFKLPHQKIIEKELREYEEADYIQIPSTFTKKTYLAYGIPEKKIIQIPYGVDFSLFRQIPKEDKVFRVIYAGNMGLQKGTHYLLQAFSELRLPNAELFLIGSRNEEIIPFFEKYASFFKYVSSVPQRELYRYYSQGSVFVMPSIQEGLALVQAQAMACGLPVIATINTGGEDIIRDGKDGFIIPIRDTEAIKEKILYFYEHPETCIAMGQSAKEHIAGKFTWDAYGNTMIEAYQRILEIKGIKQQ